jgi:hypothetical protein
MVPLDDGAYEIQGRRLEFPVRIESAAAACAVYLVPAVAARPLVAGTGLDLVTVAGRTPVFLALVDYRRGDLGVYHEVGLALLARRSGRTGPYVHQLPVTQSFTLQAGRELWGLPKWLARADLTVDGPDASCRLATSEGTHVLGVALRASRWALPGTVRGRLAALAPRAGSVLASRVRARARGIRLGTGGTLVEAGGGHPMADEVRALGLPRRRAVLTATVADLAFEMDPAEEC